MKPVSLYEFGGSPEDVKKIQRPLVEHFRDHGPVLDIGCGRGGFLELLQEANIAGEGVDRAQEALAACRARGLQVHGEDVNTFLARAGGRFGGIFASHVIEHMMYADACRFLELCHHALRPGGRLLLLTPNPADLMVISENFWLDPTHVRPYPLPLLKAMLRAADLEVVHEKQYLGSIKMIGRRNLPMYLLRRLLLGKYYGRQNTLVLAQKNA